MTGCTNTNTNTNTDTNTNTNSNTNTNANTDICWLRRLPPTPHLGFKGLKLIVYPLDGGKGEVEKGT